MAKKKENEEKKVSKQKIEVKQEKSKPSKKTTKNETKKEVKKDLKKEVIKQENEKTVINNEVVEEKKDTSKTKKIIKNVLYSLLAVVIVGALIYSIIESNEHSKYFKNITFNEAEEIIKDDNINIIYWAQPSCTYCKAFTPIVKEVSYDQKVMFNYLNASLLSDDEYATIITLAGEYNEEYSTKGLGTPAILIVQDGKIINIQSGAMSSASEVVEYLKTNNIIK